ncbi:uncharacterized protein Nmlp_1147 [Natronomonas moolapensis 8.8.11]|uniref:Uncharacterized protein n=1 Tax=Natronomonas moolapensis (strain DSM 18674 / CECT 7526 / JCM 14361 / 8.8.11) TaxID=268739 RepID=M1XK68_NATM8|nr:hypothetical protein [Natronomonas moolapensis]CCQ35357.1 uncharacterized protein Nmlp_1147 [Natronomonas moolapensis 8.8.11]
MAKTDDTADDPDEDEMLPDEAEAIAQRLDSLDDEQRRSLSDVADALDDE